jgi:hypothetical protein
VAHLNEQCDSFQSQLLTPRDLPHHYTTVTVVLDGSRSNAQIGRGSRLRLFERFEALAARRFTCTRADIGVARVTK